VPHGVGSVWAQMLWEMTWNLIDVHGFDTDFASGTGGNNIAHQLVMDGMKLQPCQPGFVDGRDAILNADTLLYDGANSVAIWTAFAKRGLGYSADQGSSASVTDGTEAFDLPPGVIVSTEDGALPGGFTLTAAYPNPFTAQARFALEVAQAQPVTVAVYDVMGREVARLHDGVLAAGTRHAFEIDGAALAAGVYLVRVRGEDFAETRRITLLR
jgi:extracellular elastinolytic metalloproteinase